MYMYICSYKFYILYIGIGYARSTTEELEFIRLLSIKNGIMLDPVYSGKALYNFIKIVESSPDIFQKGQKVLFIHTGDILVSLYVDV
jgi:D-cysteine desulfhydrase